jgi:hypothetical protein
VGQKKGGGNPKVGQKKGGTLEWGRRSGGTLEWDRRRAGGTLGGTEDGRIYRVGQKGVGTHTG